MTTDTTPDPLEAWIARCRRNVEAVPPDIAARHPDWFAVMAVNLADQRDEARAELARLRAALRAVSEKWKYPPEGCGDGPYWAGTRTAYAVAAHELDGLLPPVPIVDIERPAHDTGEGGGHG